MLMVVECDLNKMIIECQCSKNICISYHKAISCNNNNNNNDYNNNNEKHHQIALNATPLFHYYEIKLNLIECLIEIDPSL